MLVELSKRNNILRSRAIVSAVVVLLVVAFVTVMIYQTNGSSFDFHEKRFYISTSGDMDGDIEDSFVPVAGGTQVHVDLGSYPRNSMVQVVNMSEPEIIHGIGVGDVVSFHDERLSGTVNEGRVYNVFFDDPSNLHLDVGGDRTGEILSVHLSDVVGKVIGYNSVFGSVQKFVTDYIAIITAFVFIVVIIDILFLSPLRKEKNDGRGLKKVRSVTGEPVADDDGRGRRSWKRRRRRPHPHHRFIYREGIAGPQERF